MNLAAIQSALRERNIDAWLFYDHHHRDPIAYRVLGVPASLMVTRRWFYLIPAEGEPVKLVHKIEAGHLDSLPGKKHQYAGWQELFDKLKAMLANHRDLAMQYSPNNIVFYVSLVDGGTIDLIRGLGKNVVSSADLVAQFESTWTDEQIQSHFAARDSIDSVVAEALGLFPSQVCVMIHCGSRGLGHQICSDHVRVMLDAMARYHISVPDAQLACAPVDSAEGRAYLAAMAAAANYGRANRQALTVAARRAFERATGTGDLALLYDVSHNLAKLERHDVGGERRLLCVHRKGATLALPPGHPDLPADLRAVGQPVLVPGSMGTASHLMVGIEAGGAFSSTCHGAGRTMSRHAAARQVKGEELRRKLEADGIAVRATSTRGLAEETPVAYKDVDEVVASCERAGLARRVARLRPLGVVKG